MPGELPKERKVVVSAHEWHLSTDYGNRAVASLRLPPLTASFCPDGLVVVPSLAAGGAAGQFRLEVHSDCAGLRLEPLADGRAKTLAAEWGPQTAGGSHMHRASWKKNPRFHLKLLPPPGTGSARVKVTLSRPPGPWRPQLAKDQLGCMLGVYICKGPVAVRGGAGGPGDEIWHEGEPWTETPFVPAHTVATPPHFELPALEAGEPYTIVCATFEPGKVGPFVLSATADCDFTLVRDGGGPEGGGGAPGPVAASKPAAAKFAGMFGKK